MPTRINIPPGTRFGILTVTHLSDRRNRFGQRLWECLCDCGNATYLTGGALRSGNTKSCGCNLIPSHTTHGMAYSPEYKAWMMIKERCFDPNCENWERYGGRGITICPEWADDFSAFLAHVGRRPRPSDSIERIDNDGNYEPGNVKWATKKEQARNRRSNVLLTYNNETMTLIEWSERTGFSHATISQRLRRGMTVEQALTTPLMKIYPKKATRAVD